MPKAGGMSTHCVEAESIIKHTIRAVGAYWGKGWMLVYLHCRALRHHPTGPKKTPPQINAKITHCTTTTLATSNARYAPALSCPAPS